jgi:hypothetical protein
MLIEMIRLRRRTIAQPSAARIQARQIVPTERKLISTAEPADGISAATQPALATVTSIRPVFMGNSRAGSYRTPKVESTFLYPRQDLSRRLVSARLGADAAGRTCGEGCVISGRGRNLARHHSITSSARASSVGGISRPSAFAVREYAERAAYLARFQTASTTTPCPIDATGLVYRSSSPASVNDRF